MPCNHSKTDARKIVSRCLYLHMRIIKINITSAVFFKVSFSSRSRSPSLIYTFVALHKEIYRGGEIALAEHVQYSQAGSVSLENHALYTNLAKTAECMHCAVNNISGGIRPYEYIVSL